MSRFEAFVREEMDRQDMTLVELERRSGIPDSTLSRILGSEVEEPKPSQIARIAQGLGLKFWVLMQHAGYTTETPDDPDDEARRLATVVTTDLSLREIVTEAEQMTAEERDALLTYMALVRQRREQNRRKARRPRRSRSVPEAK